MVAHSPGFFSWGVNLGPWIYISTGELRSASQSPRLGFPRPPASRTVGRVDPGLGLASAGEPSSGSVGPRRGLVPSSFFLGGEGGRSSTSLYSPRPIRVPSPPRNKRPDFRTCVWGEVALETRPQTSSPAETLLPQAKIPRGETGRFARLVGPGSIEARKSLDL